MYFRHSQLPVVVDMLRNEGLVYRHWAGPLNMSVCTEYELVGDGEVKGRVAAHS